MPTNTRPIQRALLSVSDKTGLVPFARELAARGIALVSTGGTRAALAAAGLPVMDISELTGFPEMMDGRVKTLHPKVHGGLLSVRGNPEHEASLLAHAIQPIDLVVVNLYPFRETVARGADYDTTIENIDIGGPAMIRSGAKNHDAVCVVVDPRDYDAVLAELDANKGETRFIFRKSLAAKAYGHTASYDRAVSTWFAGVTADGPKLAAENNEGTELRYGENPHQSAKLVIDPASPRIGVASARQVQGKALSYNNLNDADAAFECVAEFAANRTAAIAIIKHANPCGVAEAGSLVEAYRAALACDPVSAFGGIVAANRTLDAEAAKAITEIFTEVIIAPDATEEAIALIAAKKNLRLLLTGGLPDPRAGGFISRTIAGGALVQSRDNAVVDDMALKVVTNRAPTEAEMADLRFAYRVVKHVKSNAIVYAKAGATVGIGAGQMSRVDSARIAAWKAGEAAKALGSEKPLTVGSVAASDAFFPFADGLEALVAAGATAVIQPGGSMRDQEVIDAANKAGLAMVFTGTRHFRH
ncbi:MAG: bifunctional phosphoribosylaminoimidazolecarboxamide formyltransferase/IMP cyclohydrolase [Beijerinckiaceae bacterium]|jgi:phosphoribosylaminoimidazolecarboxamide formyltransferase/IMP cyclohydrolase|nr:bifunctional phosphoribosylaminoimidazolecarboxamide formyltransferase/IMP cyclohydrolase [Beijerinckiaceae bacterium]